MVPFYIYYSMFGFQRVGDFIWAGGDSQARGFLIGGTAGRTTLAGEGLQHQDGHSQLLSTTVPNCVAYDPTFAYELAVIIQDGLRRMFAEQEDIFYYITCMNENYAHPAMPKGVEQGILKGMYLLQIGGRGKVRVNLMGSGTILREVIAAAEILERDYGVPADVFSVPSFSRAAPRSARRRAPQPAASGPAGAAAVRAPVPRRSHRAVHRGDRLHEDRARPDPPVGARPLHRARHRRLRPQRFARAAAPVISKSTRTTSCWLRCARSPTRASSTWRP